MSKYSNISSLTSELAPISLDEMESVKLMNRIDTKFAVPLSLLPAILEAAKESYYIQQIDGKRIATYDTMYYDTVFCTDYPFEADSLVVYPNHEEEE